VAQNVLLFGETTADGTLRPSSAELFGLGKELAGKLGGSLVVAIFGGNIAPAQAQAAALGADRILSATSEQLAEITVDAYSVALEAAIEDSDAGIVLLSGTTAGRDLAAFESGKRGAAHLVDAVNVEIEGDGVIVRRPVYQAKLLTEARAKLDATVFVTVRSGSYAAPEAEEGRTVDVETLDVALDPTALRVQVVELLESKAGSANLEAADIVVIGGRGLGEAGNFPLAEQLAEAFGGAVGATRAVTDLGWRPHYDQVGQTGRVIAPNLYVGVGVSGAVQHTVGMRGSENVVAINRDPDAPIFKLADFGIVGDLFEIVPLLIERLNAARGN
jgi:electron transfer flavoprotein alpha subunit